MRKARAAPAYQVDVARDVELFYFHFFHPAVLDFPLHAHARDDGYAHAHLHEALDAFDGGHLDGHVELRMVAGEKFDHPPAERGLHNVRDKNFAAEVGDVHFTLAG